MKAIICGAGIAGLALAQRLDAIGWEAHIVEHADGPREQGYMIDFFGPGADAMAAMGLSDKVEEIGYHVDELVYNDGQGRRTASLRYALFEKAVSAPVTSLLRPDLERILRESLPETVTISFRTSITDIDNRDDGVTVTLTDGRRLDADLLVGADGIHSTIRRMTFGPEEEYLRYLGMHTAAFVFDDPALAEELGAGFRLTDAPGKQVGLYGVAGGRVATFTVHTQTDPTLPADPRAKILDTYRDLGWKVPHVLANCPPSERIYYDQVAQIVMPRWSHKRVTVIGDAAYAVSLLAGQGASLAIAGAYVLAGQLDGAASIDGALAGYERAWGPVATHRQDTTVDGRKWLLPETMFQVRARRLALAAFRIPGVAAILGQGLVGRSSVDVIELAKPDRVAHTVA
ncbi:MAG TPA: FAD-dependent monooxygenase [Candidatus Stackebrandtia faecavium]|nr:FAD-dependent monooxygenase [Candidatus Stackebrandtia faecavium]